MGLFTRQRRWRSEKRRPPESGRASGSRVIALYAIVFLAFAALSTRLLYMQVLGGSAYRLQAEDNRIQVRTTSPVRGAIFDRAGRLLVTNVPVYTVSLIPAELPEGRQRYVLDALQRVLGVPAYQLEQKVSTGRHSADPQQPIVVKAEVDDDTRLILEERHLELPGVRVSREMTRVYAYSDILGNVLGYTGRITAEEVEEYQRLGYGLTERVGKAGVELSYEDALRGQPGREQVEVDASGTRVRTLAREEPQPGNSIVLAIDGELQKAVGRILSESIAGFSSRKAVAMMMDVRTGEILASVSLPSYDNNLFSFQVDEERYATLLADPNKPLLDHAIAEKFAPGSTFKMLTGVAALQEGVATTRTTIVSRGGLLLKQDFGPDATFPDWHPNLGALDFYRGVAMSSDVYFYCLSGGHCEQFGVRDGLGNQRLARYARMFGFGELTGIDLPNETEGLVGDAEWLSRTSKGAEQWYTADTFFMGIGQGYIESTPLQVLRLTATVANGGNLLRPRVVREVRAADGTVIKPNVPDVVRRVAVDPKHLQTMREAMRLAVAEGTTDKARVPGVTVAGKTGTAEFGQRLGEGFTYGRYRTHGWVTAFAPYENPEVAVVVFQEEGSGATTAAPTASRILDYYFNQRPKLTQTIP